MHPLYLLISAPDNQQTAYDPPCTDISGAVDFYMQDITICSSGFIIFHACSYGSTQDLPKSFPIITSVVFLCH